MRKYTAYCISMDQIIINVLSTLTLTSRNKQFNLQFKLLIKDIINRTPSIECNNNSMMYERYFCDQRSAINDIIFCLINNIIVNVISRMINLNNQWNGEARECQRCEKIRRRLEDLASSEQHQTRYRDNDLKETEDLLDEVKVLYRLFYKSYNRIHHHS